MSSALLVCALGLSWLARLTPGRELESDPPPRFANPHELLPRHQPEFELLAQAVLGDLDGDGDLEALLAPDEPYPFGAAVLWRNLGEGHFEWVPGALDAALPDNHPVDLLDVEGDGDLDVRVGSRIFRNDGHGGLTLDPLAAGPAARAHVRAATDLGPGAAGDLDGDGDIDRLVFLWGSTPGAPKSRQALLLNDGHGNLVAASLLTAELAPLPNPAGSTLVDLDADGDLDVVLGDLNTRLHVYWNDGDGRFRRSPFYADTTYKILRELVPLDADGDGDLDVMTYGSLDGARIAWFEQSDGTFVYHHVSSPDDMSDLEVGDVDDDGDGDVLFSNEHFFHPSQLLLNDGAGTFSVAPDFPVVRGTLLDAQLLDLDHDGDLDALFAGPVSRLFHNGPAGWSEASATLPFVAARSLAASDLDADGDVDLLVADDHGAQSYRNDGTGLLVPGDPLGNGSQRNVALVDVDGDGDPDGLVSGFRSGTVAWENDGQGRLAPASWTVPFDFTRPPAFGDVDADGDLDALSLGELWFNLTRQVSWSTLPRPGRTLRLELSGEPDADWTLLVAPRKAEIPTPVGLWRLDPASTLVFASGQLDARGTARVALAVPKAACLVGRSAYWQGLFGNPVRLGNRETTFFSGL